MRTRLATLLTAILVVTAACGTQGDAADPVDPYASATTSPAGTTATAPPTTGEPSTTTTGATTSAPAPATSTTTSPSTTRTTAASNVSTTSSPASSTTTAATSTTTTAATSTTTTAASTTTSGDDATEARIEIEDFRFQGPATVPVGTVVTVVNRDSVAHTWTATDGTFDSGRLGPGDSFTFVFDAPGEFGFFCAIHPSMTGTITVGG